MKYRNIIFEQDYGEIPLLDKTFTDLEKKLNLKIPSQYKKFLLEVNGGVPDKSISYTKVSKETYDRSGNVETLYGQGYSIMVFYSVNGALYDFFEDGYHIFSDRIPSGFIPIAMADGGDIVIMGTSGAHNGKVYGWSHDEEAEVDAQEYFDNVFLIDETFNDFLDGLISDNQCDARYRDAEFFKEESELYLGFQKGYETDNNNELLAINYLKLAFMFVMLADFDNAKSSFIKGVEWHEELKLELPKGTDWKNWLNYLVIAEVEFNALPDEWRIRFADRIRYVKVTNVL